MHPISNFLLSSRFNAVSRSFFEAAGDNLLAPFRILLGGREVVVLNDGSVHAMGIMEPLDSFPRARTILKIIAVVTLPLSLIGVVIKLPCFKDKNYRKFCMQKLPQGSSRVVEIYQHIHSIRFFVSESCGSEELIFHPPSLAALNLYECSCGNTGEFHRLNNSRRNKLEKAIVQHLAAIHPHKNQPIHLLSMGSGGLMSDFITLEKLILKGFKNIHIDCVDPIEIDLKKIEGVREFFSKCSSISVNISAYKNINEIHKDQGYYSAVLAVDYNALASFSWEDCLNSLTDLVKARSLLNENGFLALGFSKDDTLSGKKMETITLTSSSLIESLTSDLIQQLKKKNELLLALSSFKFAKVTHFLLYTLSLAIEKSGKFYNKVLISSLSEDIIQSFSEEVNISQIQEERKKQEKTFETMSRVLFPNAEVEICYHEQDKKYDLLFTGSKEKEFISNTYSTLLNEAAAAYVIYPRGIIYRQNSHQQNESVQVFSGNKE